MNNVLYDKRDPISIEAYAKKLIGHTFIDVLENRVDSSEAVAKRAAAYGNAKRKGGLGNLLEEVYFGYKANNASEADFKEAGVELKATPYEKTKTGELRAGERLVLSMINYAGPIEPTLQESHVWKKCKLMLLIYYWRNRELKENLYYQITFASLFTPPPVDLAIIEDDYKTIAGKVMAGKAEELSESDTFYLGACTKGATAEKSLVSQWYPPHTLAKTRAFCYKTTYMTFVLNEYLVKGVETYEQLIKDPEVLQNQSFSEYIVSTINRYAGKSDRELCKMFNREYNNNKAQWVDLAYRMLGIRSNRAEEFQKANIVVKAVRLEQNGKMVESMSFPVFRYKEIIEEEWEDSTLHNYFDETRFLFVVFRRGEDGYILKGAQLWNMPHEDLNQEVRRGWQRVVDTIKDGVKFNVKTLRSGEVKVENNFPKKADNRIVHIRPHANKRYFEFPDGTRIGDGKRYDANPLPDGTWMPNYCFWLNNDYIIDQLKNF